MGTGVAPPRALPAFHNFLFAVTRAHFENEPQDGEKIMVNCKTVRPCGVLISMVGLFQLMAHYRQALEAN